MRVPVFRWGLSLISPSKTFSSIHIYLRFFEKNDFLKKKCKKNPKINQKRKRK